MVRGAGGKVRYCIPGTSILGIGKADVKSTRRRPIYILLLTILGTCIVVITFMLLLGRKECNLASLEHEKLQEAQGRGIRVTNRSAEREEVNSVSGERSGLSEPSTPNSEGNSLSAMPEPERMQLLKAVAEHQREVQKEWDSKSHRERADARCPIDC